MLTALPMYPHQEQAVDALTYAEPELISFPTGGGKGVMIAHVALRWITKHPGDRVLVGVHTEELVQQLYQTIKDVCPHLDVGIVKGQQHNDVHAQVIVFSVQTLRHAKRRAPITGVGLLIWDEAHHATAASYRTVTDHFPDVALVGFTATPERGDRTSLGSVWKRVAASRDVSWMVRHKWLIPPYGKAVEVPDLDLTKVKRSGGDYQDGALGMLWRTAWRLIWWPPRGWSTRPRARRWRSSPPWTAATCSRKRLSVRALTRGWCTVACRTRNARHCSTATRPACSQCWSTA